MPRRQDRSDRFRQQDLLRPTVDNLVDQTEIPGRVRREEVVALERVLDLLQRLAGMLDVNLVQPLLQVQNLLSVQHDICRLALEPAGRLMHHDARVRKGETLILGAGGEQ